MNSIFSNFIALLYIASFILLPWLMTRIFIKRNIEPLALTYLLTGIILMILPFFLDWVSSLNHVAGEKAWCRFPLVLGNIVLLPVSMTFQLIFNVFLSRAKTK